MGVTDLFFETEADFHDLEEPREMTEGGGVCVCVCTRTREIEREKGGERLQKGGNTLHW